MSQVVLGVGASHSTLMNTHWDEVTHRDRAERFRDGLAAARDAVAAAEPDVVVIAGSNHFRGFWLDLVPAFTMGVGEVVASGEAGTPAGPQRTDPDYARLLLGGLVERDFDVALSARLQIDHGQSHAIQYVLRDLDVPVVPLVVNVFAPPLPTLRRCWDLGRALGATVAADGLDRRVAVVASGGLSHRLPFPVWYDPHGEDEEFLVEAWLEGRGDWQRYDPRRREIVRAFEGAIEPAFDQEFLSWFAAGRADRLLERTSEELEARAGNGAHELRSWLVAAGALAGPASEVAVRGQVLAYEPMPEWLTGMAVAVLEPVRTAAPTLSTPGGRRP